MVVIVLSVLWNSSLDLALMGVSCDSKRTIPFAYYGLLCIPFLGHFYNAWDGSSIHDA